MKRKAGIWHSNMKFPAISDCIFIDIETDIDAHRVWLIGLLYRGKVDQFLAENFDGEDRILREFGTYLSDKPGKPLICYSTTNFDFRVIWKRLIQLRLTEVQNVLKDRALIDMGTLLRRHFTPFGRKYSLKFIRYLIGYEYENEAMRGDEIAIRYYRQVKKFGSITWEFEQLARSYNKDDIEILQFMLHQFEENIDIEDKYTHNLSVNELLEELSSRVYSYRMDRNIVRISVYNESVDDVQALLMRIGCPLPERNEGVNVTALYWKSRFSHKLMYEAIKTYSLDLEGLIDDGPIR